MPLTDAQIIATERYHRDGKFSEPLVRCDSCVKLILMKDVTKNGMCACGNTRVRNVRSLRVDDDVDEIQQVRDWIEDGRVDPAWLDLWVAK